MTLKIQRFIRLVCLVGLAMSIMSCAMLSKIDPDATKKALLKSELERWSSFQLTGQGDAKYGAFQKRCETIIKMANGQFSFDMIDGGGLLGLVTGGKFLSAFTDGNTLKLKLPGAPNIVSIALDNQHIMKLLTTDLSSLLAGLEGEIISNLSCNVHGVTIRFTEKMQIREVEHVESKIKLNFTYNSSNELLTVAVASSIFNMSYDVKTMERTGISISPL